MDKVPTQFLPIDDAAIRYDLSIKHILRLGAEGHLQLVAPAFNEAMYKWPNDQDQLAFPWLEVPVTRWFGKDHRVYLHAFDVAAMELDGEVVVNRFAAPLAARDSIEIERLRYNVDPLQLQSESVVTEGGGVGGITRVFMTRKNWRLPDMALWGYWSLASEAPGTQLTSVEHLLVPTRDLEFLARKSTEARDTSHGNSINAAILREEVFAAAIYLLSRDKSLGSDPGKLAKAIRFHSERFWPDTYDIPMDEKRMAEHLTEAFEKGRLLRQRKK